MLATISTNASGKCNSSNQGIIKLVCLSFFHVKCHTILSGLKNLLPVLLVLLATYVGANEQVKEVKLAYVSYPPYYGSDLEQGGPITQIIEETFALAGYQVTREQLPWARAYQWTREGNYDALYTAWYRPDREQHFMFSVPLLPNEIVLMGHISVSEKYLGLSSLSSLSVGNVRGYAIPEVLSTQDLNIQEVTSDRQNIEKLIKGYIDVTIIDKALGRFILKQQLGDKANQYEALSPSLKIEPQYLIFSRQSKGYADRVRDFNKAYGKLEENGRVREILQRHDL